jgi:hypothetical protein
LLALITTAPAPEPRRGHMIDLMQALTQSMEQADQRKKPHRSEEEKDSLVAYRE